MAKVPPNKLNTHHDPTQKQPIHKFSLKASNKPRWPQNDGIKSKTQYQLIKRNLLNKKTPKKKTPKKQPEKIKKNTFSIPSVWPKNAHRHFDTEESEDGHHDQKYQGLGHSWHLRRRTVETPSRGSCCLLQVGDAGSRGC